MIVRHSDKKDNQTWNQNFIKDLFQDVADNKGFDDQSFFIMTLNGSSTQSAHSQNVTLIKADENDDLAKKIFSQFDQTSGANVTNVVMFLSHSGSMKYAVDATPKLMKRGIRIFVVAADKVEGSKKSELTSIAGDFENLLIAPKAKEQHLSDRFLCKSLYVWRTPTF